MWGRETCEVLRVLPPKANKARNYQSLAATLIVLQQFLPSYQLWHFHDCYIHTIDLKPEWWAKRTSYVDSPSQKEMYLVLFSQQVMTQWPNSIPEKKIVNESWLRHIYLHSITYNLCLYSYPLVGLSNSIKEWMVHKVLHIFSSALRGPRNEQAYSLWQVVSLTPVCLFTIQPVYKVRFTADHKGSQNSPHLVLMPMLYTLSHFLVFFLGSCVGKTVKAYCGQYNLESNPWAHGSHSQPVSCDPFDKPQSPKTFALWFIIVAKLHSWGGNKSNFMAGGHHNTRTYIKVPLH